MIFAQTQPKLEVCDMSMQTQGYFDSKHFF